jgi:hypothetical protein
MRYKHVWELSAETIQVSIDYLRIFSWGGGGCLDPISQPKRSLNLISQPFFSSNPSHTVKLKEERRARGSSM